MVETRFKNLLEEKSINESYRRDIAKEDEFLRGWSKKKSTRASMAEIAHIDHETETKKARKGSTKKTLKAQKAAEADDEHIEEEVENWRQQRLPITPPLEEFEAAENLRAERIAKQQDLFLRRLARDVSSPRYDPEPPLDPREIASYNSGSS